MLQDIYTQTLSNNFSLDLTHYYNPQNYNKNNFTCQDRTPFTYLLHWSKTNMYYYGVRWKKKCLPTDLFTTYFTSSDNVKKYISEFGNPDIIIIDKIFNSSHSAMHYEHLFLKYYNAAKHKNFLNKTNGDKHFCCVGHTEETKRKISSALKDIISNMSEAEIKERNLKQTGRTLSSEHKAKLSLAGIGRPVSEETRMKMSISNKGRVVSEETKAKLSEKSKGNQHGLGHRDTEETRKKKSLSRIGKKSSLETCKKIGDAHRGKFVSEESRKNMSIGQKNKAKILCEHCNKEYDTLNFKKWHGNNCKKKS